MGGLTAAEAETRAAYLGTIRALAAALDARDPYTAGHSERVSALSVLIARQLQLREAEVDIIRLGALLHDIGKIGARRRHPAQARAADGRRVRADQAPSRRSARASCARCRSSSLTCAIVELHHERPDGHGYPFGLRGDDIPLAARIVHVADAFDAMTSARAYRPARAAVGGAGGAAALLRARSSIPHRVDALHEALAQSSSAPERQLQALLGREASA